MVDCSVRGARGLHGDDIFVARVRLHAKYTAYSEVVHSAVVGKFFAMAVMLVWCGDCVCIQDELTLESKSHHVPTYEVHCAHASIVSTPVAVSYRHPLDQAPCATSSQGAHSLDRQVRLSVWDEVDAWIRSATTIPYAGCMVAKVNR